MASLSSLTGLIQILFQDNLLTDITPLTTLTNLNSANVSLNFLDIAPGADDRLVIDDWIVQGANVTFSPQRDLPEISITPVNGNTMRLGWDSSVGLSYQLQHSTNLLNWFNATNPPRSGTGNPLSMDVFTGGGNALNFRLQVNRQ